MGASAASREWTAKFLLLSAGIVLGALACMWIAVRTCFPTFIMGSGSMENTILRGDGVMTDKVSAMRGRAPNRDELAVYRWPLDRSKVYLHRIVGIPGDRLQLRDKRLFRNGQEVPEPYTQHTSNLIDAYRDNFPNTPNFPLREPAIGHAG
jgi:signal peptidase I